MKVDHDRPAAAAPLVTVLFFGACFGVLSGGVAAGIDRMASATELLAFAAVTGNANRADERQSHQMLLAHNGQAANIEADQPFHTRTVTTPSAHLAQKWQPVANAIREELHTVSACSVAPDKCSSDAAKKFRHIMEEASQYQGRARLAHLNRAVNLAVKYTHDTRTHGVPDHWASAFDTIESGAGDCEDYAITKYTLLRAMNWRTSDLRIVLVYISRSREYHAVEATHLGHDWLILDNVTSVISQDSKLANYHPLFIIDESAIRTVWHPSRADGAKIKNWNGMD